MTEDELAHEISWVMMMELELGTRFFCSREKAIVLFDKIK